MLIDCPNCVRSYAVSRDDVGERGRQVICPRCKTSWFVEADGTSRMPANDRELSAGAVSMRISASPVRHFKRRHRLIRRMAPVLMPAACVCVAMVLIGARERIVRAIPQTAGLYSFAGMSVNVRGLAFAELTPARVNPTSPDITVSGVIRNVTQRRVVVPRVVYQVRDSAGTTLATWTEPAAARSLAAGHSSPFVSSPHALPPDSRTVFVRFETDRETPAPIHVAARASESTRVP